MNEVLSNGSIEVKFICFFLRSL